MIEVATPAMDARRRMAWTLAALAATVVTEAMARGSAWLMALLLASAFATLVAALARRPVDRSAGALLAHLDVATATTLVFLLLPAQTSLVLAGAAMMLSVLLARNLFGGLGQNMFNPAMLALAIILLASTTTHATASWTVWAVLASWLGGGLLVACRLRSWREPFAFIVGALIISVVFGTQTAPVERIVGVLLDPALVLCAFFVAGDSASGCLHARARWAFGLGGGALVMALDTSHPGAGLPFAMLAMNFLAPWLDQVAAKSRRGAIAQ